jgi:hypothetical protein
MRTRCPAADTERSQYDFHRQRAKDESHYPHQNGRSLPTDHPQNRIRKKQQKIGQENRSEAAFALIVGSDSSTVGMTTAGKRFDCATR